MSGPYARGKRARGICDVCGLAYKLSELKEVIVRRTKTGTLACRDCWDSDHPQNFHGELPVYDPQALRNPRPDSGELAASRALVLPQRTMNAVCEIGSVIVSTS